MAPRSTGRTPSTSQRAAITALLSDARRTLNTSGRIVEAVIAVQMHDAFNDNYEHSGDLCDSATECNKKLLDHYKKLSTQNKERLREIAMESVVDISRWVHEIGKQRCSRFSNRTDIDKG